MVDPTVPCHSDDLLVCYPEKLVRRHAASSPNRRCEDIYIYIYIHIYIYICNNYVYIYIYINRERERERERDTHIPVLAPMNASVLIACFTGLASSAATRPVTNIHGNRRDVPVQLLQQTRVEIAKDNQSDDKP